MLSLINAFLVRELDFFSVTEDLRAIAGWYFSSKDVVTLGTIAMYQSQAAFSPQSHVPGLTKLQFVLALSMLFHTKPHSQVNGFMHHVA